VFNFGAAERTPIRQRILEYQENPNSV
jgi:hypothetical protein